MKKFLLMLLSLSLVIAFAACSPEVQEEEQNVIPNDAVVEEEQELLGDSEDLTVDAPETEEEVPAEEDKEVKEEEKKPVSSTPQKPAESKPAQPPQQTPSAPVTTPEVKPEEAPTTQPETPAVQSPAKALLSDFKTRVNGGITDPETLASALIGNEIIPFMGASMAVEPGYLNGFDNEITGFSKGAMFGPAIGTIPFVGYIFEVDANTDVNTFIQTLKDNANLRWNICTSADEMVVDSVGKTVFFVMTPAQFEE